MKKKKPKREIKREGEEGSSAKGWSCETNWTVTEGSSSLEASISVNTSDEDPPDLTSDGTLLLRPSASDDPPSCEVTVFFKGKYEIQKVYARTSARIFEIYYTKDAERNSTKEYLCTVKCGPASSYENLHGSSQNSSVHSSEEESWVDVKTPLAIRAVTGPKGCLLIVMVAGAAADAGLSLIEVAGEAKHAVELVRTMGIALSVCTLPGQVISDHLDADKMEIGLRIDPFPA